MNPARILVVSLLVAFSTFAGETTPRIIGYYAAWNAHGRKFFIKNLKDNGAAERLTHISYAFANISNDLKAKLGDPHADIEMAYDAGNSVDGVADSDEKGALRGSFNQLRKLKAIHPKLRVLISIGGWGWSSKFSDAALTETSRKDFVTSCVEVFIRGKFTPNITAPGVFDGIDLDWEYPGTAGATKNFRREDTENFTALLAEFRAQLEAQGKLDGKHYELTMAAGASPNVIGKLELAKIREHLDFINVMTYDFHGGWDKTTNFHSPLFTVGRNRSSHDAVKAFVDGGVPSEKVVLGIPFYGRGWKGVAPGPANDGLFQPVGGDAGSKDFRELKLLEKSFDKHRHLDAQAFWIFDREKQIFWSYDDPESIANKMRYVLEGKLGGAMFWELGGDDDEGTLVKSVYGGLRKR